jgi:hypothetical protein
MFMTNIIYLTVVKEQKTAGQQALTDEPCSFCIFTWPRLDLWN